MTEENNGTSVAGTTATEMTESLTGYEEHEIEKHFKFSVGDVENVSGTTVVRGLVFVHRRRAGDTDLQAYDAAMSVRLGDLETYFDPEVEEVDPEEPVTPMGEGSALSD